MCMCVIVDVTHELVRFSPPGGTKKPPEGEGKKSKKTCARVGVMRRGRRVNQKSKEREEKFSNVREGDQTRKGNEKEEREGGEEGKTGCPLSLSCSSLHAPHGSVFLCPSSAHVPCALAAMQRELLGFFRHEGKPRERREREIDHRLLPSSPDRFPLSHALLF